MNRYKCMLHTSELNFPSGVSRMCSRLLYLKKKCSRKPVCAHLCISINCDADEERLHLSKKSEWNFNTKFYTLIHRPSFAQPVTLYILPRINYHTEHLNTNPFSRYVNPVNLRKWALCKHLNPVVMIIEVKSWNAVLNKWACLACHNG